MAVPQSYAGSNRAQRPSVFTRLRVVALRVLETAGVNTLALYASGVIAGYIYKSGTTVIINPDTTFLTGLAISQNGGAYAFNDVNAATETGGFLQVTRNFYGAPGVLWFGPRTGSYRVAWLDTNGYLRLGAAAPTVDNTTVVDTVGPSIFPFEAGNEQLTSGAAPIETSKLAYDSQITTGGTQAAETVNFGDGTGMQVGRRKMISLATLTDPADVLTLDAANMVNAAGAALVAATIDAEGGFVMAEWNGAAWQVRYSANATLTT